MFKFIVVALLSFLLLFGATLLGGWYAVLAPLMPGLFDIEYTTDMSLVRVPMRTAESDQTMAIVMLPAAYVPSKTQREGKLATMALPIQMSFPDLSIATQAPADHPEDVTLKTSHITPVFMTSGCNPEMFTRAEGIPAGAVARGAYYRIDATKIGRDPRKVEAYLYLDRLPQNSIVTTCERDKCVAMMYLGSNVCAALDAPASQFDNVLKVEFLFALRNKLRGYVAVRRDAEPHSVPAANAPATTPAAPAP